MSEGFWAIPYQEFKSLMENEESFDQLIIYSKLFWFMICVILIGH